MMFLAIAPAKMTLHEAGSGFTDVEAMAYEG